MNGTHPEMEIVSRKEVTYLTYMIYRVFIHYTPNEGHFNKV